MCLLWTDINRFKNCGLLQSPVYIMACAFRVTLAFLLVCTGSSLQITGASQEDAECAACNLIANELQTQTSGSAIYSELRRMEVMEASVVALVVSSAKALTAV